MVLQNNQASENFWNNLSTAQQTNIKISEINEIINIIDSVSHDAGFVEDILKNEQSLSENELFEIKQILKNLEQQTNKLYLNTLLNNEYDKCGAIITIHSGAGGTESSDWVQMLARMYFMYSQKHKFKTEILDAQNDEICGYKNISFKIEGKNVYGFLSAEKGVHRLVRISPFDSNKRRHTTFASVDVMPLINLDNNTVEILDKDIKIDTFRSSGAGGQNINKTDSAVRITYLPLNIVVSCQTQRSQLQNKQICMQMLKAKLLQKQEEEKQSKINQIKGTLKKIEWGSQIRSYVFCPYTMVKDHRTDFETANLESVLNGELDDFILEYLKRR